MKISQRPQFLRKKAKGTGVLRDLLGFGGLAGLPSLPAPADLLFDFSFGRSREGDDVLFPSGVKPSMICARQLPLGSLEKRPSLRELFAMASALRCRHRSGDIFGNAGAEFDPGQEGVTATQRIAPLCPSSVRRQLPERGAARKGRAASPFCRSRRPR